MSKPLFTVFIPAFNRLHTLPRLLKSIEEQSLMDFECIIVNDGSSDGTHEYLDTYASTATFPIRVIHQDNLGKHVARNRAIQSAEGLLFFTIDSDDVLLPEALLACKEAWDSIAHTEAHRFAGVEGLCVRLKDQKTVGSVFPSSPWDSDHITSRYIHGVRGDKARAIRTEIFRKHLYPEIPGEKFIAESFAWNAIGLSYQTRYINIPLISVDYQEDGLSASSRIVRSRNPRGAFLYYSTFIHKVCNNRSLPYRIRFRASANLIRYSLHCGLGRALSTHRPPATVLSIFSLPIGLFLWADDCIRARGS